MISFFYGWSIGHLQLPSQTGFHEQKLIWIFTLSAIYTYFRYDIKNNEYTNESAIKKFTNSYHRILYPFINLYFTCVRRETLRPLKSSVMERATITTPFCAQYRFSNTLGRSLRTQHSSVSSTIDFFSEKKLCEMSISF